MNIYHRMMSRKVAPVKPINVFSVLADSDSDSEVEATIAASIEIAVEPALRIWPAQQENRFEEAVAAAGVTATNPFSNGLPAFNQRGRWTRSRVEETDDGWTSLRPRYEATTPPFGDVPPVAVTPAAPSVVVEPRTAQEWADTVRQSLERAETNVKVDSTERMKDIRESLGRLSFFRRPMVVE
jgi:hypothetical protein